MSEPSTLVRAKNLVKEFSPRGGIFARRKGRGVRAVDGVSFEIQRGETLALVGESGCGKSTMGRLLMRLIEPTSGEVDFDGIELLKANDADFRTIRRRIQLIFQDPASAFNPRMTVGAIIAEPMRLAGFSRERCRERVKELLPLVGLADFHADRYPHEFSGGQRQRIGIARSLAVHPEFIICDEPVSALDVSIQAQVINLLTDLQKQFDLTYLFISHDLRVVRHIADRVAVMYLGRIVEIGDKRAIYSRPLHPYTQALIAAVPLPEPGRATSHTRLTGEIPSAQNIPSGCRFHPRCPYAMPICHERDPATVVTGDGRQVACHLVSQSLDIQPQALEPQRM
ncbi:ATP-binding cassette domain-containing protein [Microvirga sp. BT689]|uniref:ABC transporter ATP-binding protein n=1 Tax=Microvirga arvi TaxID=2778731 RepID=UPI0019526542|nr:oligopeptide/dipeptide ABC transporter ATP-binding protein [Microvirga arvi]MBM6581194.1 ATP-binding cassette domain-containing protein [Microvirga arvi]